MQGLAAELEQPFPKHCKAIILEQLFRTSAFSFAVVVSGLSDIGLALPDFRQKIRALPILEAFMPKAFPRVKGKAKKVVILDAEFGANLASFERSVTFPPTVASAESTPGLPGNH